MIKSRYLLRQEEACTVSGNFVIHEKPENANNNQEQVSEISDLHIAPQEFVGKFEEEEGSWCCCCSFRPIKSLQLQMYGQRLSQSSS